MVNDAGKPPAGKPRQEAGEAMLDELFAAARRSAPMPSRALWERVLADAGEQLPSPPKGERTPPRGRAAPRRRWLAVIGAVLNSAAGGWGLATGLATAMAAGLWIGYAHPSILHQAGPWEARGPGRAMAGMGADAVTGFDLEDFEPLLGDISVFLEDG